MFCTGRNAASFSVAQNYIQAFEQLAQKSNTLILPSNVGDVNSVVGTALSIYSKLSKSFDDPSKHVDAVKSELD